MKQRIRIEVFDGVEVPVSPLLKRERSNRYGSIPDLDDEELIEPAEIDRVFLREAFAPILALPVKGKKGGIKPNIDEDGSVDWGAFGTVDFDKYVEFDKLRYKADKLREELLHERIIMEMLSERIKSRRKYKILEQAEAGLIDVEEISDFDMFCLAKRYVRAKRIQREIAALEKKSQERREDKAKKVLGSLD
ncbi:MAG: hypothetical protein ABIG61_09070 [Planctomycetota bacterium]